MFIFTDHKNRRLAVLEKYKISTITDEGKYRKIRLIGETFYVRESFDECIAIVGGNANRLRMSA